MNGRHARKWTTELAAWLVETCNSPTDAVLPGACRSLSYTCKRTVSGNNPLFSCGNCGPNLR